MSNLALTKTDRTRNVGAFLWLIVCKFFHVVSYLVKKINWRKVGFVSWRVTVLVIGIALAFAKLVGSMMAGLWVIMRNTPPPEHRESGWVQGDDFYDPASLNPHSLVQIEEDDKRRWHE